jgi:hypothetical protein
MSNYQNNLVRSPSASSINSWMSRCISFDDNASLSSKNSADAVNEMLQDFDRKPQQIESMIIDITSDDDDDSVQLIEPLPALVTEEEDSTEPSSWINIFSPEEEHRQLAMPVPRDSTFDENHCNNDLSYLLTEELLEPADTTCRPTYPACVSANNSFVDEDECILPVTAMAMRRSEERSAAAAPPPQQPDDDVIARIIVYIQHNEQDLQLVNQMEEIVRACTIKYRNPKCKKHQNLAGNIFEGLVQLFGGPRFHEIYQKAMTFNPNVHGYCGDYAPPHDQHHHPSSLSSYRAVDVARTAAGPSRMQLAIAYGMHLARFQNNCEPPLEFVQAGVESLNSMTEQERQLFWQYYMTSSR